MNYFFVTRTEFRGWDCDGHRVTYVVAAHSPDEAIATLGPDDDWNDDTMTAVPVNLPPISPRNKRKPYILPI